MSIFLMKSKGSNSNIKASNLPQMEKKLTHNLLLHHKTLGHLYISWNAHPCSVSLPCTSLLSPCTLHGIPNHSNENMSRIWPTCTHLGERVFKDRRDTAIMVPLPLKLPVARLQTQAKLPLEKSWFSLVMIKGSETVVAMPQQRTLTSTAFSQ